MHLVSVHLVVVKINNKDLDHPVVHFVNTKEVGAQTEVGTPLASSSVPAGNTSRYSHNWPIVTNNSFILRIVQSGYKLQFENVSSLPSPIISSASSDSNRNSLLSCISKLLDSGAVSEISPSDDQVVSRIFIVKKSNGSDRLILDLSNLNKTIRKIHFKMESFPHLKSLLSIND